MDWMFGLVPLPWWGYILVVLLLTHVTIAAVTIFLHRAQAHRALDLHPLASHFFRLWLWPTTGMVTKEWVAIHRKHHAKCETIDDPHSPQTSGLHAILWLGVFFYVRESHNKETLAKYGYGTPDDWIERKLYAAHPKLGVALMFLVDVLLFGVVGPLIWIIQMGWIPFWAAGVINGVGHFLGYRNADTHDASHNIVPWGILIGGEELHNNHHAHETSAKLSSKWYEFDLGWAYIRILEFCRLAAVRRLAPQMERSHSFIDEETISFLRRDRGSVRRLYRMLLLHVVKQELRDAEGDVRDRLVATREVLRQVRWNNDTFPEYAKHLASLQGTRSSLPHLGKFAELLAKIQASHTAVKTSPEREASLISELDQWARSVLTHSAPKAQAFARMLVHSVVPRIES